MDDENILNDTDGFVYGDRWDEWKCYGAAVMACRLISRTATDHSPLYELTGKRPIRSRLDAEHRLGDDFVTRNSRDSRMRRHLIGFWQ